jgi:signal transduction histidine kinase
MKTRTIGSRLAISFGVAFLAAGTLLLVPNYTLIERQLSSRTFDDVSARLELLEIEIDPALLEQIPDGFDPTARAELAEQLVTTDGRTFSEVLGDLEASVRHETLDTLLAQGIIAIIAVGAVAVFVGWWLSHRALRPVAEITRTAQMLSDDDLSARVDLKGPPDEITELADTFDAMLDRLEHGYTQHHNFAGVASHELRTPLAVMRVEADNALDDPATVPERREMAHQVLTAVAQSERMIKQLMALTRSGAGLNATVPVDLADVVGAVAGELSGSASSAGVRLDLGLADAVVDADQTLLEVPVTNLIDNAIVHNVEGGSADISVESGGANARLVAPTAAVPIPTRNSPG